MKLTRREFLAAGLLVTLAGCSGSTDDAQQAEPAEAEPAQPAEQPEEKPKQTFAGDAGSAEYAGAQDVGNIALTFYVQNDSDVNVLVTGENLIANGEYSVQALGGSAVSGIQPKTTGSVTLAFGVEVQTPLAGPSELTRLSGDLVMHNNESLSEVVGTIPFDIEVWQ